MISKKRDGSIVTFIGNNFISLKRRGANRISPLSLLPSNLFDRITIIHRTAYVHFLEIRSRLPMIGRYSLASVSIQPHPTSLFLSLSSSTVVPSSSIFHATFNYERLSRCQGDVTRKATGRGEKVSHSSARMRIVQPITSRGRTVAVYS